MKNKYTVFRRNTSWVEKQFDDRGVPIERMVLMFELKIAPNVPMER